MSTEFEKDLNKVRIKESLTAQGIKHDAQKVKLELLSSRWLMGVGAVLTYGAKKYTKTGECTCSVRNANELLTREDFVEIIMTSILKERTPDTQDARLSVLNNGLQKLRNDLLNTIKVELETRLQNGMELPENVSIRYLMPGVKYVVEQLGFALITTTEQELREAVCASLAMLGWGGLKTKNGIKKHESTCNATKEISGEHNWRKGLQISRLLGACLRHVVAFLGGENLDSETGISHLYHASCCLMFASELMETKPEMDDRYKE